MIAAIGVVLALLIGTVALIFLSKNMFTKASPITREEVAAIIERFVAGISDDSEWDDFTCLPLDDPYLDSMRERCLEIEKRCLHDPPGTPSRHAGVARAQLEFAAVLRQLRETRGTTSGEGS